MKSSRSRTSRPKTTKQNKQQSSFKLKTSGRLFTTATSSSLHSLLTTTQSTPLSGIAENGPISVSVRQMAKKVKGQGSTFQHGNGPNRKAAKNPHQIQLGLTRRTETAMQMVGDSTPTAPRNKTLTRITKTEQSVKNKLKQLELFLSHDAKNYSLGEILSIYNTFKEVRFAAPPNIWARMMSFWQAVGTQPALDPANRQRALKIPVELFDELVNMNKTGVYAMMKQKNVHLPEHLLQFNLRPTTQLISAAMSAMQSAGNHQGVIDLYNTHREMLNEIPAVQYLPDLIMPEGPEKEQELVSRRLMAKRRAELSHNPRLDGRAIEASAKLGDMDLVEGLMGEFMVKRSYQPTKHTVAEYSNALNHSQRPLTNILFFKEYFQTKVDVKNMGKDDFEKEKYAALQKLVKNGTLIEESWQDQDTTPKDDQEGSEESKTTGKRYRFAQRGGDLDVVLPEFLGHSEMKRDTTSPIRRNWVNLLQSIAQLHPEAADLHLKVEGQEGTGEVDTKTTALVTSSASSFNSPLNRFAFLSDATQLVKNTQLRRNLYKIAKEQYGLVLDKTFFLPMIKESNSYNEVLAWLDDFHDEIDQYQQKFKENPWTEEEQAEQEKQRKIRSMLVVNLNVTPHDARMRKLFGRYVDEVKGLGYDDEFYTAVHSRLVNFLVDSYQGDENDDNQETIDTDELYDIETVVGPDGSLRKVRKLKVGEDGNLLNLRSGKKPSLYELFKQPKASEAGSGDDDNGDGDDGEEEEVAVTNEDGTVETKKIKKNKMNVDNADKKKQGKSSFDPSVPASLSTLPPPLTKTAMVNVVDKFNRETTDMLLSSTSRHKVKHILSSIQTVRAYQEVYGLPVSAKSESKYLESLILMTRRNEIYPPVLSTSDTSLIKFDVAPYIPSFDGEKQSGDPNGAQMGQSIMAPGYGQPLVTFRDRLTHIHKSIRRREDQLRLTLQEIEHSIDALSTMKNETDEYGRLKKVNVKILNDVIESLSELSVDASLLRGPFDGSNIFHYSASKAHEALGKMSRGELVEGMKVDPSTGAQYLPGVTEPHPYQVDYVDLETYTATSKRIGTYAFGEMKHALQLLIQLSTGMSPQQTQHIPLLKPDEFGSQVTENTYIPLLRSCAAHGDYNNVLLLIESAHQHRDVVPTTNMLNFVASAFMNSDKQRHAAGVLDIMETASKPENRKVRKIKEEELSRAITHGTASDLIQLVQSQLEVQVLPNSETISLLIRMYKSQGMLDHVEELWRRLTYHDPTSWTSFSAVEEQQMVSQVLAAELDAATTPDHPLFEKLRGTHKGSLTEMPDLSMAIEDAYDKALNPVQNKHLAAALKHDDIRTNMKALLHNRPLDSNLPAGAHRSDIPRSHIFNEMRLDSASITAMLQTFIQLGHPMHALQIYLDLRQQMPLFPITAPKATPAFTKAREINRFKALHQSDPNYDSTLDSLTDFMIKTQGKAAVERALVKNQDGFDHTADAMIGLLAVPVTPSKRSFVSESALVATNAMTSGAIEKDATGTKIDSQTTINMNALSPRMVQMGHASAANTYKTTSPSDNALVNSNTYEQLMSGTSKTKTETAFEQIQNGKWPEVDAIASVALYTYKKGEQYLKKVSTDGKTLANIPPEVLVHAKLLVDASQRVLQKLKRYAVETPYLPGDPSTLLYYSNPGTLNNIVSPNAGVELTQPRLLLPFIGETVDIFKEIDSLVYSDIALEETVFKIRYQTIKPIGMQRWFTIFPTMINQCKGIVQSEQSRNDINAQLDMLRDDVEMLLATGRRKPKYVRIAEIIEEKRVTGAALTQEETLLIESHQKEGRTERAESDQLHTGGLFRATTPQDRGISHPKTSQFVDAALPAVTAFDVSEFTKKDDATKAWVGNFKNFFNSKSATSEFLAKITATSTATATTIDSLDADKKAALKAKLLGVTSPAPSSTSQDAKKSVGGTDEAKGTQDGDEMVEIDENEENDQNLDNLPLLSRPPTRSVPSEKFDRWVEPEISGSQVGQDGANGRDSRIVKGEATPDGNLPLYPFMSTSEKSTNSQALIQQIQAELRDAHNGVGLYPRAKGGRTPLIGADGKIKTDFVPEAKNLKIDQNGQKTQKSIQKFQNGQLSVSNDDNDDILLTNPNFKRAENGLIYDADGRAYGADGKRLSRDAQMQAEIDFSTQLASSRGLVPGDVSFKRAVMKLQQTNVMDSDVKHKKQNSLLLPEVQKMKTHLSKQAASQQAIMDQYVKEQTSGTNVLEAQGDVALAGYSNKLQQMMGADLTLIKPYRGGSIDHMPSDSQPAQWLSSPTDIAIATQVTERHVAITKDRFKPLPGVIDEDLYGLNQRGAFMNKITGDDDIIPSKTITPQRPGGIHTSPHGPQSFRPDNQFRSPSAMARMANAGVNAEGEVGLDEGRLAVDNDEKNIKFKVATHGVAMSDRPGRPTQISQEYLEKYLMGIGADPKDKRSQARHAAAEAEFEHSPMDPHFIQMGDPNARITNRGGGILEDGSRAGSHQQGYGVGVHKFRERSQAKLTNQAREGARRLLQEFEQESFVVAPDGNPLGDGNDLEGQKHKIPKKEREALEYRDLFSMGGDDDEIGSAAMSRTGQYNLLTPQDRKARDEGVTREGFADLEAQMEALLAPRAGQTKAVDSLGSDFNFSKKSSSSAQSKRIKEVFSSAAMHSNKADYFGLQNKGGRKSDNQSTMFD